MFVKLGSHCLYIITRQSAYRLEREITVRSVLRMPLDNVFKEKLGTRAFEPRIFR